MKTAPDAYPQIKQIFIVEDHPIVRHGLRQLIGMEDDLHVCGEAEHVTEAIDKIHELEPDVALVDLSLHDGDGMELVQHLAEHHPEIKTIVVSTFDAATYAPIALKAGARGFINKHEATDCIVEAIHCVLDGQVFLGEGVAEDASHWFG